MNEGKMIINRFKKLENKVKRLKEERDYYCKILKQIAKAPDKGVFDLPHKYAFALSHCAAKALRKYGKLDREELRNLDDDELRELYKELSNGD